MLYFAPWKTITILLTVLVGIVLTVPNFFGADSVRSWPNFLPKRQLVLGLDLQGGSHILLEVDRKGVVDERLNTLRDDVRRVLRDERIGYTGLGNQGEAVQVRIREAGDVEKARTALAKLSQPITQSLFGGPTSADLEIRSPGEGVVLVALTPAGIETRVRQAVDQSIEVIRRRIDELGTTEPNIQRQGADRILVQVPGLDDPQRLKSLLRQTAKLVFRLVDTSMSADAALQGRPPAESEVLYSNDQPAVPYLIERRVMVSGEDLVDATAGFDQQTNEPVVNFRFNTSGARRFAVATQQNVGKPFAIVLDDKVLSAPVIREPIPGGTGQISGSFTVQSANDLAILLRAGALPADLVIVEERTVGPGLGQDSIDAGRIAAIIGAAAVAAFMIVSYGFFGIIANVALVANVMLIIGALTALGATLTLPGIAGIVLTIGMAVDANILIYERIREERRAGRSVITSLDAGFDRAIGTILDANITTLIAAVILFYLGSGPIRGFAITLAIGIVTTVFTAFTLTRFIIAMWLRYRRPATLPI